MPRKHRFWRLEIYAPHGTMVDGLLDMLRYENAIVVDGPKEDSKWTIEMPHAPEHSRWISMGIRTGANWVVER